MLVVQDLIVRIT